MIFIVKTTNNILCMYLYHLKFKVKTINRRKYCVFFFLLHFFFSFMVSSSIIYFILHIRKFNNNNANTQYYTFLKTQFTKFLY